MDAAQVAKMAAKMAANPRQHWVGSQNRLMNYLGYITDQG